jgi:hypothetical protein
VSVFSIVMVGVSSFEVEYDCVRVAVDENDSEKVGVADRVSVDSDEREGDEVAEEENTSVALKLELLVLKEDLLSVAKMLSVKDAVELGFRVGLHEGDSKEVSDHDPLTADDAV